MSIKKQGWLASCLLVLLFAAGCRDKGAQLQTSATPPDKELFKTGDEWLEKSQYLKARLAFQTLINTYPDSELTPISFFKIADSYYDEGGKEGLLQAEAQYKDFMVFYPTHAKTAEAQLKIAALNMKMIEAPDRDATYARRAKNELKTFLEKYPQHELRPEVEQNLKKVEDVLAAGEYGKGQFYYSHKKYKAALARYQEIYKNYPNYGDMDTVLYEMADSLIKLERPDEAAPILTELAAKWDGSKAKAARKVLADLEKPIPPEDPVMIAAHEQLRKPKEPLIKSPRELAALVTSAFRPAKDPIKEMEERRNERLASQPAAAGTDLASTTEPEKKPDIALTLPVQPVPSTNGTAPPPNPGTSSFNGASTTEVTPTGGGSAGTTTPATEEVKANSNDRKPENGNTEDSKAPKKKRGLFKRILRTGN